MLSREADVEAHALREQGWTISAIARISVMTARRSAPILRAGGSPRCGSAGSRRWRSRSWSTAGCGWPRIRTCGPRRCIDELVELGFTGSYPSLTAAIRTHGLRPHCEPCQASKGRDSSIITHPPGEETQWDWVELPNPPASWGLGREAHLLVGSLAHSGRWRAVLADAEDFPHLIEALDRVTRNSAGSRAAGASTGWPRSAPRRPGPSRRRSPRPRSTTRSGSISARRGTATARVWWRRPTTPPRSAGGAPSPTTPPSSPPSRASTSSANVSTSGPGAATASGSRSPNSPRAEGLRAAPATAFPAELAVARTVSAQALVSFRGNRYSVPPGMPGAQVIVRHRLGAEQLRIVTASGATVAVHRRAPNGAGVTVRDDGHVRALETKVLAAFTDARPCRSKTRRPLGTPRGPKRPDCAAPRCGELGRAGRDRPVRLRRPRPCRGPSRQPSETGSTLIGGPEQ